MIIISVIVLFFVIENIVLVYLFMKERTKLTEYLLAKEKIELPKQNITEIDSIIMNDEIEARIEQDRKQNQED